MHPDGYPRFPHPKPGTWDFRAIAAEYDVGACSSCDAYSKLRHEYGYADNFGTVHWEGFDYQKKRRESLHRLLIRIAAIKLKHHSRRPRKWIALWECDHWAYREGWRRFRLRFAVSHSRRERRKALSLALRAGVHLRSEHQAIYQWAKRSEQPSYAEIRKTSRARGKGTGRWARERTDA